MLNKIEEKLETFVRTLNFFKVNEEINNFDIYYAKSNKQKLSEAKNLKFKKYKSPKLIDKSHCYFWFKCEFDINKISNFTNAYVCVNMNTPVEKIMLRRSGIEYFDGQRQLMQNAENFLKPQGLMYLNGEDVGAIDINHRQIKIEQNNHYEMYLFLYTDNFENNFSFDISIKYCDKRIENAYYDYLTILENIGILLPNSNNYKQALNTVNKAINIVDFRNKDKKFFNSLDKSTKYIYDNYFKKLSSNKKYTVNCVGHSHIDMAWLWDIEQTRHKSQRTFSTVLKLMQEYPEYKFIHTSPQLFEFLKKDNFDLYNKIKQKVKEGRFEIDGAMWVEPDCNLTSGESLVRQIYYGKRFIKEEFETDSKILFLPDVFGYAYQLPQILKKSEIDKFSTTKIGWNDTNRFPFSAFMWKGLDGTEIFSYLISTCFANPKLGIKDTDGTTYNGNLNANEILGTWNRFQSKKYSNVVFTTYGYGDGGGGPTREMLEKQRRYSYGLPGLGKTKISSLKDSLDDIESNFNKNCVKLKNTPVWNDELYLEYHRGTYTSVPWIKKENRKIEFKLLNAELISTLNFIINNSNYPQKKLDKAYKKMLLHQFHDILPGSSIEKIYIDAKQEFKKINKIADDIVEKNCTNVFTDFNSKYNLLNPNSFSFNYPVLIDKKCYIAENVPSIGISSFTPKLKQNHIVLGDKELSNEYFEIKFNEYGEIVSLKDKINNKQIVKNGDTINKFVVYEDIPFKWDNWEISTYYKEKSYQIKNFAKFIAIDQGDRKGFKIIRKYYDSKIEQQVFVYNKINRIDFINKIKWNEKRQLLKVHFPLNVKTNYVQADTQFGSIQRATKPKNSYDKAKFEICAHKWVDMSDGNYGVALLNNGKYGHSFNDSDIALTLLKSGSYPNINASKNMPKFTYSLYPHKGNYKNSNVVNMAYALNRPAILYKNINGKLNCNSNNVSFISIKNDAAIIETVKKEYDGNSVILRGYEHQNKKKNIIIDVGFNFKEAYICNLLEKEIKKLKVNKNTISLNIKPFEIFTIKLK